MKNILWLIKAFIFYKKTILRWFYIKQLDGIIEDGIQNTEKVHETVSNTLQMIKNLTSSTNEISAGDLSSSLDLLEKIVHVSNSTGSNIEKEVSFVSFFLFNLKRLSNFVNLFCESLIVSRSILNTRRGFIFQCIFLSTIIHSLKWLICLLLELNDFSLLENGQSCQYIFTNVISSQSIYYLFATPCLYFRKFKGFFICPILFRKRHFETKIFAIVLNVISLYMKAIQWKLLNILT